MEKKKKMIALWVMICIICTIMPINVEAAGINQKNMKLKVGVVQNIKLSGTTIRKVSIGNKKMASVKKLGKRMLEITGKNEGKTTVTITGKNKKKYKCKITILPVLSKNTVTIQKGKSVTISLKGSYVKSIKNKSHTVATAKKISSNKVKIVAKKIGATTVTLISKKKTKLECKVKVISATATQTPSTQTPSTQTPSTQTPSTQAPGSISLNKTKGVLLRGEKFQLIATGTSSSITYTSSNPDIVSVDKNGLLYANGFGQAKITASSQGKSCICEVTAILIEFSAYGPTILPSEEYKLDVTMNGGSIPYTLESSNQDIATVSQEGIVTGVVGNGGNAEILAKITTMNGVNYAKTSVRVKSITDLYSVSKTEKNSYTEAEKNVTSALSNGMDASFRILANQFGKCENAQYDHCNGIASIKDGVNLYYFVSDTWNNRVLVYKVADGETWNNSTPVYCVMGQENTSSNRAGYGLNQMNWPVGVAVGKDSSNKIHIYVTDTTNNRILVWNGIPNENGSSAAYSIRYMVDPEQEDFFDDSFSTSEGYLNRNEAQLSWPWAIWTDGNKLICTATSKGYILEWDNLPTKEDLYPDKIIYSGGTPRTIITDGDYLMVGDHNASNEKYDNV